MFLHQHKRILAPSPCPQNSMWSGFIKLSLSIKIAFVIQCGLNWHFPIVENCSVSFMHISPSSLLKFLSILHFLFILNWLIHLSRLYIIILLISLLCRVHHTKYWTRWITVWNQYCQKKYQQPQICKRKLLIVESKEELKSFLMTVKEDSDKSWLKIQHSKN